MRLTPPNLIAIGALILAVLLSFASAYIAVNVVENRAEAAIRSALAREAITWVDVQGDGLQVRLSGTAQSEARRFRVVTITGTIIDANRVIDNIEVTPTKPLEAPQFSLELLRNDSGVSMIGLIPADGRRTDITNAARNAANGARITDMLNTADYPAGQNWNAALDFGLKALEILPRSKISVTNQRVVITAISDSRAQKHKLEAELLKAKPADIIANIDISAPRPVITPFTLRLVMDESGTRFDACSADTTEAADRILTAAKAAGATAQATCTVGLGVPTPAWGKAVESGIRALAELGGGSLTFSDADVTLVALDSTEQSLFDRVTGALDHDLPEVFSLHAVLPEPIKVDGTGDDSKGPPEFVATKSPEGLVQLRGRMTDDLTRTATESYAFSRFGYSNVTVGMRLDPELPGGWPLRVLTGLEGLAALSYGSLVVQPDFVELRGKTGDTEANARIAQLFGEKLGDAQHFKIEVEYLESLDPATLLPEPPDPAECVSQINDILAEHQITFEPSSVTIDGPSRDVVAKIAEVLKGCSDVPMEIGGHTDSQGREEMNKALSQQRAEAVLNALLGRRVLTTHLTAKGYGESEPIAENDTEEGREANRRIEFKLIDPAAPEDLDAPAGDEPTTPATDETPSETTTDDSSNEPN